MFLFIYILSNSVRNLFVKVVLLFVRIKCTSGILRHFSLCNENFLRFSVTLANYSYIITGFCHSVKPIK